jgi:hypothetical protein
MRHSSLPTHGRPESEQLLMPALESAPMKAFPALRLPAWVTPVSVAFFGSLLLTVIAHQGKAINLRRHPVCARTALEFLDNGFGAARQVFNWPFLPILMALVAKLTGLGPEHAGYLLNALFMAGAGASAGFLCRTGPMAGNRLGDLPRGACHSGPQRIPSRTVARIRVLVFCHARLLAGFALGGKTRAGRLPCLFTPALARQRFSGPRLRRSLPRCSFGRSGRPRVLSASGAC